MANKDKKILKVAVIGCGNIGTSAHIPAYMQNDEVEIKYFCDIIPERAQAQVDKYGVGEAIEDYHVALNDPDVDIVSVCTPNNLHRPMTVEALEAGKDVLCEKPAARTYEDAKAMLDAYKSSDRMLSIGVVNRFNTQVNKIRELIEEGALGDVHHVYVSFRAHRSIPGIGGMFTTKEISGGGVLIDWGVHYIDIVMYCLNDPKAKTVSAETFSKLGTDIDNYTYVSMWSQADTPTLTYDVDDSMTALVRTEKAVFTLHGAWAQNIGESETYIDFMGDKGGIRLQYGGDFTLYSTHNGMLTETKYKMKTKNMFHEEINAFVETVRTREPNAGSIERNILTSELMQAIYDSAEQHREVVLDN